MLLSIIIPTYNSAGTIADALESIVNQTFADYEVLVIDNASSDDTLSIVNSYALSSGRIRFISEHDDGIYSAMNKGILMSKGSWLYFLGSDDRLTNGAILMDVFSEDIEDVDLIYGNVELKEGKQIYDGKFDLEKLVKVTNICHQAIFYRRNLFPTIGLYNTDYKTGADWYFNIQCFLRARHRYIEKTIAVYNNQGRSSTYCDLPFQKARALLAIEMFEDAVEVYNAYKMFVEMKVSYENFPTQYENLRRSYDSLQSSFENLRSSHESLLGECASLRKSKDYRLGRLMLKPMRLAKRTVKAFFGI